MSKLVQHAYSELKLNSFPNSKLPIELCIKDILIREKYLCRVSKLLLIITKYKNVS